MPSEYPPAPPPPAGPGPTPGPWQAPGSWPVPEPGILGGADERPPEIDGPPRRTSPKTLALAGLGIAISLLLFLPQFLVSRTTTTDTTDTGSSGGWSILIAVIPLFVGAIVATAGWIARTYRVGADELVIDEGVFRRRRRVVPYGRVQQIDIDQKLLAQLFRVGTLTIETAGGSAGKVKLGLLDIPLARGLRRYVLARRAQIQAVPAAGLSTPSGPPGAVAPRTGPGVPISSAWSGSTTWPPAQPGQLAPETVLVRLDSGRLAVAGFTHHFVVSAVPALVLLGLAIGALAVPSNPGAPAIGVVLAGIGISLLVGLAVTAFVLIHSVIGRHGYTLGEQGDDLHLRFGLLQVHNLTIPRRRVQHVTVLDNPLRRALGLVSVQLHSAAPPDRNSRGHGQVHFEVPILNRSNLDGFLHALMGGDWKIPELTPRTGAARRRAIVRRVGILLIVMVLPACSFVPGSLALLAVPLAVGIPWGLWAHRRAGYGETGELAVLARGVFQHHVDLVPHSRLQSAFTIQNPMQHLSALRTLHVNVAGRSADPRLSDMPGDVALEFARVLPRRSHGASF